MTRLFFSLAALTLSTNLLADSSRARQVLTDFVTEHRDRISHHVERHLDTELTIVEVIGCIAHQSMFGGGIPYPTERERQTLQTGVVGTCHVVTDDCPSGCTFVKAITFKLADLGEPKIAGTDASIASVSLIDYDE